jgi:hypothetical protein
LLEDHPLTSGRAQRRQPAPGEGASMSIFRRPEKIMANVVSWFDIPASDMTAP